MSNTTDDMFHPKGPTFFELARQALSSTERGYDLLAPKFDFTPFRTPETVLIATRDQLTPWAPFDNVLDACCGTGAAMQALLPLCRGKMVGIDMSRGMLNIAQRNVQALGQAQVEFVRGDVLDMTFDQNFDLVVSFSAFGHIRRRDEMLFLQRVYRSLRSGGMFAFVTHEMPPLTSTRYWYARGFNAAMHLRNLLLRPPFIMYYLTFLWPDVSESLNQIGFQVRVCDLISDTPDRAMYKLVLARRLD